MQLQSGAVVTDPPPVAAIEDRGARAALDAQILVRVDSDLLAALDAAARRERLARGSFAQRVLVAAVDQDDGATANPPQNALSTRIESTRSRSGRERVAVPVCRLSIFRQ